MYSIALSRVVPAFEYCGQSGAMPFRSSHSPRSAPPTDKSPRTLATLLRLSKFYGGDWPPAFVTSDRNSQAVEFIKPNLVYCPGLSISQDDSFANKLGLSLIERRKDGGRLGFGAWHGVSWVESSPRPGTRNGPGPS
jgi:hypothetical protein